MAKVKAAIQEEAPASVNPFLWQGSKSALAKDEDFNGTNHKRSLSAQKMRVIADIPKPRMTSVTQQRQINAYSSSTGVPRQGPVKLCK